MDVNPLHTSQQQIHTSATNQIPIPLSELAGYQEWFEKIGQQKKRNYLQAIKSHNHELIGKIKQLDKRLNSQLDALGKRIVPNKKRSIILKLQELQTPELSMKFQELKKLKKQLQIKRTGTDSLQFLLMVKQQNIITLSSLDKQISKIKINLAALTKIKTQTCREEQAVQLQMLRVGDFNMHRDQIQELRRNVKEKNEQNKVKKQEFIKLYNKNRSNRSLVAESSPKSMKDEEIAPELAQLKHQYLQMGNKIATLKSKKNNLKKNTPNPQDHQKILDKLKLKYESLSKLSK